MNKCPICNIGFFSNEEEYNLALINHFTCLNCKFKYGIYKNNIDYIEFNYNSIYRIFFYSNSFSICKFNNIHNGFYRFLIFYNENINTSFSGIKEVYNLSIKYIDNMVFL